MTILSRLNFVLLLFFTYTFSTALSEPNLIVIMTDDLGYADVGFNGCKDIPTPHIDSIATNGVKFTNGYVSYSVCGPSRAGFITGRYQQRFGFERNPLYRVDDPNMGVPTSETTIAEALSEAGYHCGVIGKWHLGVHESLQPLSRGFDEFYGHLGGGHRYLPEELTIKDSMSAKDEPESYQTWILRNHEPVPPTKYLTDEFSDEGVSFVERNHDKPFFLFMSYNAPHTPMQATEEYLARFADIEDPKRRTYAAMVSAVDDGVGRILEALRKSGAEENTLVFFLSDNGGPYLKNASQNTPLRGGKSDIWEGGHRVPFALQWPARIKKGTVYDEPVISLDIFGTIAALSGAKIDPERPLDGVNLIPYLKGKKEGRPHEVTYMRKFDQNRYLVRRGDFKLVIPGRNMKTQLYNLADDIGEENDLAATNPEKLAELEKLRQSWEAELMDPRFTGLSQENAWKAKKDKKGKGKKKQAE